MAPIRIFAATLIILGLSAIIGTAIAQEPGSDKTPTSRERPAKAWKLQAASVAATLDLPDADTAKLTAAYVTARRNRRAAIREAVGAADGNPVAHYRKTRELDKTYASTLKEAFAEPLDEDTAAKAAEFLVVFDRIADTMTATLARLGLEDVKTLDAVGLVGAYAAGIVDASEQAIRSMSMKMMLTARQELRAALDDELAALLNEEQLAAWKDTAQFPGPRSGRQN